EAARRTDLRDVFERDEREKGSGAEPAVLFVEEEAEEIVLPVELDDVPGKLVRLVDLGRPGRDALAGHRPDEVAKLALLVGEPVPGHGAILVAARRSLGLVTNRLDVVSVRIQHEGA